MVYICFLFKFCVSLFFYGVYDGFGNFVLFGNCRKVSVIFVDFGVIVVFM